MKTWSKEIKRALSKVGEKPAIRVFKNNSHYIHYQ